MNIGSEDEFHAEMNAENAVIVKENPSYHSRELKKCPTSAKRKPEIQDWLVEKE